MAVIISLVLYTFGILTLVEGVHMFRFHRDLGKTYKLYGVAAIFSSVWSIGFGLLPLQTDPTVARVCRAVGMIGVFLLFFTLTLVLVQWLEGAERFRIYVSVFSGAGILLWPFIIGENSVTYFQSWIGMTYQFSQNIFNTLYNIYCVVVGVNFFVILVCIKRQAKRRKLQVIVRNLIVCCVVVMIGMVFDTILPVFGFEALPASTLTQSMGVLLIAQVLRFQKTSEITVENFSGFVYYSVSTPVLIYDEHGRFCVENNGAIDFLRSPGSDERKQTLWETFDVPADCLEFDGNKKSIEAECHSNNRFCQIEISKIHDEYEDTIGYIAVLYDLTEKRNFIRQLQESEHAADMANHAKSNFLARMSHEIRTPINGVIGMNEMILEKSTQNEVIEYAKMVKTSAHHLIELVNDILDISKIEANHMVIENNVYLFRELLCELYVSLGVRAKEKKLDFTIQFQKPMPVSLNGDEKKVRQILMNIAGNAIKYTRQGSVTMMIDSFVEQDQYFVKADVTDTGVGIAAENIDKIFDAFERVDAEGNRNIEGTGLGLSIVKSLVELMGGRIEVQSTLGEGSTFTVILPQRPVSEETFDQLDREDAATAESDVQKLSISIPDKKILVVDDNEINRIVASGLLAYTKATIETAESGRECLELVRKNKYDFILLDHLMPEMDGIEVLRELKNMSENQSSNAVHIVLTANAIQGAKQQYLSEGFDDYLSKPIDILEVEKVLKKYLS